MVFSVNMIKAFSLLLKTYSDFRLKNQFKITQINNQFEILYKVKLGRLPSKRIITKIPNPFALNVYMISLNASR